MCVKEKGPKEVLQEPRCKGFKKCEGRQEDSRKGALLPQSIPEEAIP